jgi:hypothetical protein
VTREAGDMTAIKALVAQGAYQVDFRLVADAVMLRLFGFSRTGGLAQSECSKPSRSVSESKNFTPG